MSKRYDDPIEVEVEPVSFAWRGNHYRVEKLLKRWRQAGEGWDPAAAKDLELFRVEAAGGVYDLLFDRLAVPMKEAGKGRPQWRLERVWD